MVLRWAAVAAVACWVVLAAGCAAPQDEGCPAGATEHMDAEEGYAYCVPAGWQPAKVGSVTVYVAPGAAADGFGENVNVVTEDVGSMASAQRYRDQSLALLPQAIDGFELVGSAPFEVRGEDGASVEYTGRQGALELRWFQVYAVHDGTAYVATYTAEEEGYAAYLQPAKDAFSTLRFL